MSEQQQYVFADTLYVKSKNYPNNTNLSTLHVQSSADKLGTYVHWMPMLVYSLPSIEYELLPPNAYLN